MATLGNTTATSLTLYGPLNTANNTWNKMGDDSAVGDHNIGGHFCIQGLNNTPGIAFFNSSGTNFGQILADNNFVFNKNITLKYTTAASNAINAATPTIEFSNSDRSQYLQLKYTDYDSVQGPDSLTLVGNQANSYFIAPNIKATTCLYGPLTGNVTGNCSGSSGSCTGNSTTASKLAANTECTYGINSLQYFNQSTATTSGPKANANPTNAWYHIIRMNHGNSKGYFVDIACGLNHTDMYMRRITAGSDAGWVRMLSSANWSSYCAAASHSHSYLPLSGGTLTGDLFFGNSAKTTRQLRFLVGDNDYARVAAGATASNAGWMEIATADDANEPIYVRQYSGAYTTIKRTATLLDASGNTSFPGTLTATSVYNAIYNDYAEFFPRGEETEPGDVIALDLDSDKEQYVKSTANNRHHVVGVHSDDYAMIIGGDKGVEMKDNEVKYIPVSLMGRIKVKYIGAAKKGNYVVASEIRGVARAYDKNKDSELDIFGFLLEEDDKVNEVRRLKIKVKG